MKKSHMAGWVPALLLFLPVLSGFSPRGDNPPIDTALRQIGFVAESPFGEVFTLQRPGQMLRFSRDGVQFRLAGDGVGAIVKLTFDDVSSKVRLGAEEQQPGVVNRYLGADPSSWRSGLSVYSRLVYLDLHPGIDLAYEPTPRGLKSEFRLRPGADPGRIVLAYEGIRSMRTSDEGALTLLTSAGPLIEAAPVAFQEDGGKRFTVEAAYRLLGNGRVGFVLGEYDRSRVLIIDPELVAAFTLGGSAPDTARGVATAPGGDVVITGNTLSSNFPTEMAEDGTFAGGSFFGDVFVTRLNPVTGALVYSTFLGGTGDESGLAVIVDDEGNAYITGQNSFGDFPTLNALQPTFGGFPDGFLAKLDPDGDLLFSTYLGGSGSDFGDDLSFDQDGNVVVVGTTDSTNFTVQNAFDSNFNGGTDFFITALSPAGLLVYSTYLGGTEVDRGKGIAIDAAGNVFVCGSSSSPDLATEGAFQETIAGSTDVLAVKLTPGSGEVLWATYLGGDDADQANDCDVDESGRLTLVGQTVSLDLPLLNDIQGSHGGIGPRSLGDAFISQLGEDGSSLLFSTYVGGSDDDVAAAVEVVNGTILVAGDTFSPADEFPVDMFDQLGMLGGRDAWLSSLTLGEAGAEDVEFNFLGGELGDAFFALAVNSQAGAAYAAGGSQSALQAEGDSLANVGVLTADRQIADEDSFLAAFTGAFAGQSAFSITKEVSESDVVSGAVVTYTLTITNTGLIADDFDIVDEITAGRFSITRFTRAFMISSPDLRCSVDPVDSSDALNCRLQGLLQPGMTVVVKYEARAGDPGIATNEASVLWGDGSKESDRVSITVEGLPVFNVFNSASYDEAVEQIQAQGGNAEIRFPGDTFLSLEDDYWDLDGLENIHYRFVPDGGETPVITGEDCAQEPRTAISFPQGCNGCSVENLNFERYSGPAIRCIGCKDFELIGVKSDGPLIDCQDCEGLQIRDSEADGSASQCAEPDSRGAVTLEKCESCMIVGSSFQNNGGPGVTVLGESSVELRETTFVNNEGLGFDLGGDGITVNDSLDEDSSPNFPILMSWSAEAARTVITGAWHSAPDSEARLEFFSSEDCDPPGFGEGQASLGSTIVKTDLDGGVVFTFESVFGFDIIFPPSGSSTRTNQIDSGILITATATDSEGNTSEFSPCAARTDIPDPQKLYFPLPPEKDSIFTGYAVTRISGGETKLEFLARGPEGGHLNRGKNPGRITVGPGQQTARLGAEILGPAEDTRGGSIELMAKKGEMGSFFQHGSSDLEMLDGGTAIRAGSFESGRGLLPPVFEGPATLRGQGVATQFNIHNPNSTPITVRLSLSETDESSEVMIPARGTLSKPASEIFETEIEGEFVLVETLEGLPLIASAFMEVADKALIVFNALDLDEAADPESKGGAAPNHRLYSAQLADDASIFTEFSIMNSSDVPREMTLSAVDSNGGVVGQSLQQTLQPGESFTADAGALFGSDLARTVAQQSGFVGSLVVEADGPGLRGSVLFGEPGAMEFAAALPLQSRTFTRAAFNHVANLVGFFTGLAFFNPNEVPANFTIAVYDAEGTLVGQAERSLAPGARLSNVVPELVPESAGQAGGYIIVTSDQPLVGQMLFGATDGPRIKSLSAVPPTVLE